MNGKCAMIAKIKHAGGNKTPKLRVDLFLLIVRGGVIALWAVLLGNSVQMSIPVQIFFATIIFFSDALDGVFSRRFTTSTQRYQFRILDAFVDKIGILLFIVTLITLKKIPYITPIIIISYNVILVLPPILKILIGEQKNLQWIQATFWSRFYAFCVGIYCLLSITTDIAVRYKLAISFFFLVLGIISFISHAQKIRRLKGVI